MTALVEKDKLLNVKIRVNHRVNNNFSEKLLSEVSEDWMDNFYLRFKTN